MSEIVYTNIYKNSCWKIFHKDGVSPVRDKLFRNNVKFLNDRFTQIGSHDYFTEEVKNFISQAKTIKISPYLKWGEAGIFLSNIKAWEEILYSNFDHGLLLEDDCILSDRFDSHMYNLLSNAPDDWDIITLFSHPDERHKYHPALEYNHYIVRNYQGGSALAYLVSRSGVIKLLALVKSIEIPLDSFLFNNRLNTYAWHPDREMVVSSVSLLFDENYKINGLFYRNLFNLKLELSSQEAKEIKTMPSTIQNSGIIIERSDK